MGDAPEAPVGARRARADRVRNRDRILSAASSAFALHGQEAQMDDVAARAGVAVGTLYRHFATKEALVAATLERTQLEIVALTRRAIQREGEDPFEVLADVVRQRIELVGDDAAARAVLFSADSIASGIVADLRAEARTALEVLVGRAQAAGALRLDVDTDDVWNASCGIVAVMDHKRAPWQRHLQIVLDGLRPPPG